MSDPITVLHNPRCSTSRAAVETLSSLGITADIVQYLKDPLSSKQLEDLLEILDAAPADLVRRDDRFRNLGLSEEDIADAGAVVALLTRHPELMQRPVLIRRGAQGTRAIIGRPKDTVAAFVVG